MTCDDLASLRFDSLNPPRPPMFGLIGWLTLAGFLVGTTLLGHFLGRNNQGLAGFFRGGNNVPWWAVSASLIATKTSALTFIAVPAAVFMTGGNLTYLQATFGLILGNILMGLIFVRTYYAESIYSPYDYIENRLGRPISQMARSLFTLGALLSQAVRLLSTALVLSVITRIDLLPCIALIAAFAVIWSVMGGITTVIWTDFIQLAILTIGALTALGWIFESMPEGLSSLLALADAQAKLVWLDLNLDPTRTYTLWVGLFGCSLFELGQNAVDQVVTQRVLCCRNAQEACKAVYFASFGMIISWMMLAVGLGLFAFYQLHPLDSATSGLLQREPDRVFPHFIITEMPEGLAGLVIASIFAAGITTLDSALAALAQTTLGGFYQRRYPGRSDAHYVAASRAFIVGWAIVIMAVAGLFHASLGQGLLSLGLKVPGYTYGALLGIALLALWRKVSPRLTVAGVIVSCLTVAATSMLGLTFFWWYPVGTAVLLAVVAGGRHWPGVTGDHG